MLRALLSVVMILLVGYLLARAIIAYARFERENWRIRTKLWYASDEKRRIYWRKKKYCHTISSLPFITENGAERIYDFFHREKKVEDTGNVYRILAPALLGMCMCVVCLFGTSWAWFTATQSNQIATVQTATYQVNVQVTEETVEKSAAIEVPLNTDGEYQLDGNKVYTVTIHVSDDSTATTGFCNVILNESEEPSYCTVQIEKNNPASFQFKIQTGNESKMLKIVSQWGSCAKARMNKIENGHVIDLSGSSNVAN